MAWHPASLGEGLDDLAPPGRQGEAETGWVSKQAEEQGGRGRPGGCLLSLIIILLVFFSFYFSFIWRTKYRI